MHDYSIPHPQPLDSQCNHLHAAGGTELAPPVLEDSGLALHQRSNPLVWQSAATTRTAGPADGHCGCSDRGHGAGPWGALGHKRRGRLRGDRPRVGQSLGHALNRPKLSACRLEVFCHERGTFCI